MIQLPDVAEIDGKIAQLIMARRLLEEQPRNDLWLAIHIINNEIRSLEKQKEG